MGVLFLQLLVTVMLTLLLVDGCQSTAEQMAFNHQSLRATLAWALLIEPPPNQFSLNNFGPADVYVSLVALLIAGVWLGSCFPHWRWWKLSLAWALLLTASMSTDVIGWALFKPMAMLADVQSPYIGPSLAPWSVLLSMVGALTVAMLLFFPLGLLVRDAWRNAQSRRWIKLLARSRRDRRQS